MRYNKSNTDKVIKSFKNVVVKLDVRRFDINTYILKMLPSTPTQETLVVNENTKIGLSMYPFILWHSKILFIMEKVNQTKEFALVLKV